MAPLILIAGVLGAGKTTLLRHLLPRLRAAGLRPLVILNDYRNAEIDVASLDAPPDEVTPIAGTCICCGSQEELMEALLGADLTPSTVLLLEANGTADTAEIIEILTADARLARYTLPAQITVVDAERWQNRGRMDELERMQVQTAGFLHLTRLDRVDNRRRDEVRTGLGEVAPWSRVQDVDELVETVRLLRSEASTLPPRRPGSPGVPETLAGAETAAEHRHRHHFSSVEIRLPEAIDEEALRSALRDLPPEVLRVKGVIRLIGRDQPVYLQRDDRPASLTLYPIPLPATFDALLVMIGVGLDREALTQRIQFAGKG